MKEALGNTFIVNFIIIFTIIFIALFVGSLTYTKAMRIKNKITDIIEVNKAYDANAKDEINAYLKQVGYKITTGSSNQCEINGLSPSDYSVLTTGTNEYRYCIFQFTNNKGAYYGVRVYMYMDLPIIGSKIEIPVYGETRIIGILET